MSFVTLETPLAHVFFGGILRGTHRGQSIGKMRSEARGSHCQRSYSNHLSHLPKCHHEQPQRFWGKSISTSMKSIVAQGHEVEHMPRE